MSKKKLHLEISEKLCHYFSDQGSEERTFDQKLHFTTPKYTLPPRRCDQNFSDTSEDAGPSPVISRSKKRKSARGKKKKLIFENFCKSPKKSVSPIILLSKSKIIRETITATKKCESVKAYFSQSSSEMSFGD